MSYLVTPGQTVGVWESTLERYYCRHLPLTAVLLFFLIRDKELKYFIQLCPAGRLMTK